MAKNVQSIIDDLESGLAALRLHFESLSSVFGGEKATPGGRKASASRRRKTRKTPVNTSRNDPYKNFKFRAKKTRKKMTMSPALRKQRQLQGRYMGLVRRLPKAKQAQVKKVRETKGYEAALKLME
ncbi:MAG TPA: hypothetical protein VFS34_05640 [Thermoanaerobaculia bacterium]|nr:hypothetical protein [Thermoanaerobaculia bacterium]